MSVRTVCDGPDCDRTTAEGDPSWFTLDREIGTMADHWPAQALLQRPVPGRLVPGDDPLQAGSRSRPSG